MRLGFFVALLFLFCNRIQAQCNGGTLSPSSSAVCSGGSKTLMLSNASSAGPFQWQMANAAAGPWTTLGSGGTSYTLTGITQTKYVRASSTPAGCSTVYSSTAAIYISATPVISFSSITANSLTVSWTPNGGNQYVISWSGGGSGTQSGASSPFTIIGLSPSSNVCVTVTPFSTPACTGVTSAQACATTLCAKPINVTFTSPANNVGKVTWSPVTGTTAYRIFYKLVTASTWSSVDTAGTNKTITGLVGGSVYAVRVAALNCPTAGLLGDYSDVAIATIQPVSANPCITSLPTVQGLSNCPNQLSATITPGVGTTGPWQYKFRRISPSFSAGVVLNSSLTSINLNIGSTATGAVWEIAARNVCAGPSYSSWSVPDTVAVSAICGPISTALVFTNIATNGFKVSWMPTGCGVPIGTMVYYKTAAATNFSSIFIPGSATNYTFNTLLPTTVYNVKVAQVYCNNAVAPASAIYNVTTL